MNTLKRKLTAILLTFAMLFSLMPALPQAAEAADQTTVKNELIQVEYVANGAANKNVNVIVQNEDGEQLTEEPLRLENIVSGTPYQVKVTVLDNDYVVKNMSGDSGHFYIFDYSYANQTADAEWAYMDDEATLTVTVAPLSHPAISDEITFGSTLDYRIYENQLLKMIASKDESLEHNFDSLKVNDINVSPNWIQPFTEDDWDFSRVGRVDETEGQYWNISGISSDNDTIDKIRPSHLQSLTITYKYEDVQKSIEVSADELHFYGHSTYYTIELDNAGFNIVSFYDYPDGQATTDYDLYAVRVVKSGQALGKENMPEDPVYENGAKYQFINWEYGDWDGFGRPFLSTSVITDDVNVYSHKVSTDESGGTEIRVMNTDNQFINEIAERYNETKSGDAAEISPEEIDKDSIRVRAYTQDGMHTNENYKDNSWNYMDPLADEYQFYWISNYNLAGAYGDNYNVHISFRDLSGIKVFFNDGFEVDIPVGENAGDLAKMLGNSATSQEHILRLVVNQESDVISQPDAPQPPADPTYDDLKELIKVSVDCSSEDHDSKTTELLANTGDQNDSYTLAVTGTTATVTVHNAPYVTWYAGEYNDIQHSIAEGSASDQTVTLEYDSTNGWQVAAGQATTVAFSVVCSGGSVTPDPGVDITGFEKDLIAGADEKAAAEKAGVDVENYYIPEKANQTVTIPYDGEVTLLYSITVTGSAENEKFVEFFITDDGATLIDTQSGVSTVKDQPGVFNGKLRGENASITFYVSKTFNADQLTKIEDKTYLVNEASIKVKGEGAIETETEIDEKVPAEEGDKSDIFAVTPADITIYMGGEQGYEAVVGENGAILGDANNSLPEPGFTITLPKELKGKDVTELTFKEQSGDRSWTFAPYDGKDTTTVYKLVPAEGQEATRVIFTNESGNTIVSDEFEVGLEVNTSFDMALYKGSGDTVVGDIETTIDGKTYAVDSDNIGELTVRGTTDAVQFADANANAESAADPELDVDNNTTFTINDSNVLVTDEEGIALLFDEVINNNGEDRTGLLENKADDVLNVDADEMSYDFKYLDLVDTHNGNTWVKASDDVTIYWPLPEGTDADTDFTLLHFKDLHREMQSEEEIQQKIENCDVETNATTGTSIEIVEVTDEYVVLKTGDTGFSPFALAWDADAQTGTDYVVDSFDKTLVATAQDATAAGITNAESYNYPENGVVTIERGEDVTLLYRLTVTGNADGKFMVTDKGTSLVYPETGITIDETNGTYTGTIGVDGITTFYVAKTFDAADITLDDQKNPVLVNSATIVADGDGDGTIDPGEEGGVTPGEEDKDEETDVTTEFTLTFEYDHAYALDANNERISEGQTITVDCGDDFDFTARPNSGYILDVPTIDGRAELKVNTSTNFTVENIISDVVVYVDTTKQGGGIIVVPGGDDDDNPGDNDGPSGLNTEDHFSYVVGYEDGMVKPQRSITRAEVATIFYRLLEDDVRDDYDTTRNNFSDVTSDSWYNQTVSTLASMGILKGYEDGTFRPNASITRAEFAAIATRFFEETGATYEPGTFTDVTGDEWFAGAIMDAVNLGLIGGYEDGTVRPNNNITRAEACAIVNRTLGRVPDADHLLPADEMTTWPDNPSSAWFYADMQEATNGHEYEWITEDGNKIEEWTDILDKDWNDR